MATLTWRGRCDGEDRRTVSVEQQECRLASEPGGHHDAGAAIAQRILQAITSLREVGRPNGEYDGRVGCDRHTDLEEVTSCRVPGIGMRALMIATFAASPTGRKRQHRN